LAGFPNSIPPLQGEGNNWEWEAEMFTFLRKNRGILHQAREDIKAIEATKSLFSTAIVQVSQTILDNQGREQSRRQQLEAFQQFYQNFVANAREQPLFKDKDANPHMVSIIELAEAGLLQLVDQRESLVSNRDALQTAETFLYERILECNSLVMKWKEAISELLRSLGSKMDILREMETDLN
jgi:hypothetical protein